MKPKVYVETSIISYLTARPSRDLIVAANQQMTAEWWDIHRPDFELYISEMVEVEAERGDAEAAARRLAIVRQLDMLELTDGAQQLAERLLEKRCIPQKAARDAIHIAVAAVHGMDYLLTWNCTHLANAAIRRRIERFLQEQGYESPVICTPQELQQFMEEEDHVGRPDH